MIARAGRGPGGQLVIRSETCFGNTRHVLHQGAAVTPTVVSYDVGQPIVSSGLQCAGPTVTSLCLAGDGTSNHAGYNLHSARVTIDDPAAPGRRPRAADSGAFRRAAVPVVAAATDSAGIRAVQVLLDGVKSPSESEQCDFRRPFRARRPQPGLRPHRHADGRHTVTTIAEDAASNLTRVERVVDPRRHPAGDRPGAGQRPPDHRPSRGRDLRPAGGRSPSARTEHRRSWRSDDAARRPTDRDRAALDVPEPDRDQRLRVRQGRQHGVGGWSRR